MRLGEGILDGHTDGQTETLRYRDAWCIQKLNQNDILFFNSDGEIETPSRTHDARDTIMNQMSPSSSPLITTNLSIHAPNLNYAARCNDIRVCQCMCALTSVHIWPGIEFTFVFVIFMHHLHIAAKLKNIIISVFRCVLASLKEGLSVRPSVRP